ncbi:hypothetical protein QTJ16_005903 [Diplocarpon rosae]|uniref:Uncharacterized protein n=1 Tax=Diplocarpon rosae TaxID=946125 RepID=A0AAD9SY00_9HELO|nr:hypothetical protein QTJ16_005903 [Diplocarpon rosae]
MQPKKLVLYFHSLALLAFILLWAMSVVNGTVKELLLGVWHGRLAEGGVALQTRYTGLSLLDYPLAILVAFFFHGTSGHDEGFQLFLFDAYSTLQSAFVWLYAESLRPGNNPTWVDKPVVFGLLWQCFGAAIALPLYYAAHIQWSSQNKITRVENVETAMVLPVSFLLGAVLPALIGMAPTWLGPNSRTAAYHQMILAAWQLDPIWVSWTLQIGTWVLQTCFTSTGSPMPDGRTKAHQWIRASYLLAAASSASGHLYVMAKVLTSKSSNVNLVRMYVPFPFAGPAPMEDILVWGPWLFLQYDLIIITLSSISWAFVLLDQLRPSPRFSRGVLALFLAAGCTTIGPGATVSIALYIREGKLQEARM